MGKKYDTYRHLLLVWRSFMRSCALSRTRCSVASHLLVSLFPWVPVSPFASKSLVVELDWAGHVASSVIRTFARPFAPARSTSMRKYVIIRAGPIRNAVSVGERLLAHLPFIGAFSPLIRLVGARDHIHFEFWSRENASRAFLAKFVVDVFNGTELVAGLTDRSLILS